MTPLGLFCLLDWICYYFDEDYDEDSDEDYVPATWATQMAKEGQALQGPTPQLPTQGEGQTYQRGLPMLQSMGFQGTRGLGKNE